MRALTLLLLLLAIARSSLASDAGTSFTVSSEKTTAYVGEPIRLNLVWRSDIKATAIRALSLEPAIFYDDQVQVVIPRNTAPENDQVGLPIGGRRAIATRTLDLDNHEALGTITLPIYVKFERPGNYEIGDVALKFARLHRAAGVFGRYASYFNNGFFEAIDRSQKHDLVSISSDSLSIEVLPLPPGADARFSGLFDPVSFEVDLGSTDTTVGSLVKLDIQVSTPVPAAMLSLPKIANQRALRRRFLINGGYNRLWNESGATFQTSFRPLAATSKQFPPIEFQVFDPASGTFKIVTTQSVPMTIQESDTADQLTVFQDFGTPLISQSQGIWHNLDRNKMNDLMNLLFRWIQIGFWPILLLGPVLFVALLPIAKERRRRAMDAHYRDQVAAYDAFKKSTCDSPEQWEAFLAYMAATFRAGKRAWTIRDSKKALRAIGADREDIASIEEMHTRADGEQFGPLEGPTDYSKLSGIALRINRLVGRSSLFVLSLFLLGQTELPAEEWDTAQELHQQALAASGDISKAEFLFIEAALKFEAAAKAGDHVGEAWYNAGNAWFEAGSLGRSITAYREAERYLPFDNGLNENLQVARMLVANTVPQTKPWWERIPLNWVQLLLIVFNFAFWAVLLLKVRYPDWRCRSTLITTSLLLAASLLLFVFRQATALPSGVVTDGDFFAKKGPSYAYQNAFAEPVYEGLEVEIIESRGDWSLVKLDDSRECWMMSANLSIIGQ
ncbi:MAG: hypothetical protein AAFX93_10095 [Verrucomicrobiota bacterium]